MSINLSNYETRVFPSTANISQSAVDVFADLNDSLKTGTIEENQILFAQYFNKLVSAVEETQRWFKFTSATPSGSGVFGEPEYNPTCPVSSETFNASGDGSITSVLPPYIFQRRLSDVYSDIYSSITTIVTGNTLLWEIVITNDLSKNYTNHPSSFLKQETDFWDDYLDGKSVMTSAWLSPYLPDPWVGMGFMSQLNVSHYAIRTEDHFIIRGCIWNQTSSSLASFGTNTLTSLLGCIVLNVSVLSITE